MNASGWGIVASIVVAAIAAWSARASQKAAASATLAANTDNNRTSMEKEAYERARKFDTDTIARQDEDLKELRAADEAKAKRITALEDENAALKRQVAGLTLDVADLHAQVDRLVRARETTPPQG